jgi:hypothetical protein
LTQRYATGIYPLAETEFGGADPLGPISHLVASRAWPAHEAWPDEITGLAGSIQRPGRSSEAAAARVSRARDERAARLKQLLRTHDPLRVLGRMAQCAVLHKNDYRDWYAVHGVHALVQYAVGIAYSDRISSRPLTPLTDDEVQEAFDLVSDIFALEWLLLQQIDQSGPWHISSARKLLQTEALTDRWQGYSVHMSVILRETFSRIRDPVIAEIGWNPADLAQISDAVVGILQRRVDSFHPPARRSLRAARAAGRTQYDEVLKVFLQDHATFSATLFTVGVQELAERLGWRTETVSQALNDLALKPGSQPDFVLPSQDNLARTYGIVDIGHGEYFIWDPDALVQESHTWFYDLLRTRGLESLRLKYLAARDAVTEELVAGSLARVFGATRTLGSVYYAAEGRPDVDCVVELPGDALIVECKAHLLTAAGRRGAPGRLSAKFDELITRPARQAARFEGYLRAGGPVFDRKGQSLSLQLDQDCVLPRVVVTYERVDPLAAHGPALAEANASDPAWVVSLADFLMITDLLSSPSMFWHYTIARWRQSQKGSLIVNSEADMLGLFLSSKDTFGTLIHQLDTKPQIAVGPSAQFINNYYTAGMATAPEPKKPTVAIPQPVIEALDNLLWAGNDRWAHMVEAVIAEPERHPRSLDVKLQPSRASLRVAARRSLRRRGCGS